MRIAQIAPLWERVPPTTYGGIELVVGLLTNELFKRGHDVTLFASGDSLTLAKLESVHPRALRLDSEVKEYSIYEMLNLSRIYQRADEFDIIHSHVGCGAIPYVSLVKTPTIHTLHGIFTHDNEKLFTFGRDQKFVAISESQKEPRLNLNCVATVHNGIDIDIFDFYPEPEQPPYLAFLGRMSPEKGPHLAIQIAQRSGWTLKMAGKIDPIDVEYFETQIKPHIDGKQIQFQGEANHAQKNILMGKALATLFPITWREPFGLVMIESMASGTPVIAMNAGSSSEIISPDKSGFLCHTVEDCIEAISKVSQISRLGCRNYVQNNFSAQRMTDGYEAVYKNVLSEQYSKNGFTGSLATHLLNKY
jgi:glycosyltransferase involved in cell wall biosynthesis